MEKSMLRNLRSFYTLACVGLLTASAGAQTINWNNSSGGNWNLATSWNPSNVPDTTGESAIINLAGTYAITLNASENILGLTIGNATATLDMLPGNTLTLNDTAFSNAGLIRI